MLKFRIATHIIFNQIRQSLSPTRILLFQSIRQHLQKYPMCIIMKNWLHNFQNMLCHRLLYIVFPLRMIYHQERVIKTMNSLICNYHNSLEQEADLLAPSTGEDSQNEFPSILVPVIAKFIWAEPRESTPFQDWTRMYLSLLHASLSTMDIIIQRNSLLDITKSLKKKHRFDFYYHIVL